ncbi:DUF5007 domain-containing protein [Sphingobacterium sp. SGG-5]|uniref:DUF5007 domain-containing protein n=1 Tax=Sphingobacterium sp. SGG-5 TaxID=2710881 RepID=UPI0013ED7BE1|nr:DUF5007 domain-containing protein [Sphingobacterium sp. SGG-5]NGM62509.1 DUF5007 domain-containing protein [Sphingobacterium sp. SGG-5]
MRRSIYNKSLLLTSLLLGMILSSCEKFLPEDRDSLEVEARFTQTDYEPILGRYNWIRNNFSTANSTLPLQFRLTNVRRFDGEPATELTQKYPVKVWKELYTGLETSLAEIESKRVTEYRSLLEIGESNGSILFWPSGKSSFVKNQPDSGYMFDVEVSNSGGRKYFRDLRLKPFKERPYAPINMNAVSGLITNPYLSPTVYNMVGDRGGYLFSGDIRVSITKDEDDKLGGNTLTFRFVDSVGNNINPDKFNKTAWKYLVHGFDMEKTSEYVRYRVAYPIPLTEIPTWYTNGQGTAAHVSFMYERLGFGQMVTMGGMDFEFAIYEPGDWEIVFLFPRESPKFEDD